MSFILGIDTGGTYTDCVVVEKEGKAILHKRKVLTTPQNLHCCIENSVKSIPSDYLMNITMVCLSTTLATNSIVESRGCREGLILIGAKPNGRIPTSMYSIIRGRHDIKGRIRDNIEPNEVTQVVESFRNKVDAMAISGYASVRNPSHEIYVKTVVENELKIPVVCAHELSSDLGYYERTVTAALNARLIPLVYDLIESVRSVMRLYGIRAPLMIVKGDGTLMPDVCALYKPIEMILSGPAASIIGGMALSEEKNCFVLDIGGTTTDIANIVDGSICVRNDGAQVGGWFTRVRAAEVFTVGIGGDSRVYVDSSNTLRIGPEKSMSFCRAGERHPQLMREIQDIFFNNRYHQFLYSDYEAFFLLKEEDMEYSDEEKILLEVLRYHPHTLHYLLEHVKIRGLRNAVDRLVSAAVLRRISITPTDILHVTGEYRPWNWALSELGVRIVAAQQKMGLHQFIVTFKKMMAESIDRAIIQAAMYFDRKGINFEPEGDADYFINNLFFHSQSANLHASYQLRKKIVAIGAPAQAWLRNAGNCLSAKVDIPEHSEIANALGAAVGDHIESLDILIRLDTTTQDYVVFSPLDRTTHPTIESATNYALQIGEKCIRKIVNSDNCLLQHNIEDFDISDNKFVNRPLFIERVVHLVAAVH